MDTQNLMPNPQNYALNLAFQIAKALFSGLAGTNQRQRKGQVDLRIRWRTR